MSEQILTELQRLSSVNRGMLNPQAVVDAARDKTSPLHNQFTWDDTEAAEQYRLQQARRLIRVTVRFLEPSEPSTTTRVFVSLSTDRKAGNGYRVLADVMSDAKLRAQLLADAHRDMLAFRRKYAALSELADVFAAMDDVAA
jgi:hypothetical protein